MKKSIVILLVFALLSLAACSNKASDNPKDDKAGTENSNGNAGDTPGGKAEENSGNSSTDKTGNQSDDKMDGNSSNSSQAKVDDKILEIIKKLGEGIELPEYEVTKLDSETFEAFSFIKPSEGLSGYQADALINSIPHSLVLIHSEKGNTKDLAEQVLKNANCNKWICATSEIKQVAYSEHYILLAMSTESTVKAIMANASNALNDGTVTMLDAVKAGS